MSQQTHAPLPPAATAAVPAMDRDAAAGSTAINANEEDAYWRDHYIQRPYADHTLSYDYYRPAYRYGWESRTRFLNRRWDEVEKELARDWRQHRGPSRLGWTDARLAARDAWQRVDQRLADLRQLNG